ncbi:MAG: hypothetical protein KGI92_06755 [Alphaproteobacteria bacterium]|nr:hypothetical protein [Alphaproteobacteria bacterium]
MIFRITMYSPVNGKNARIGLRIGGAYSRRGGKFFARIEKNFAFSGE